MSKKKILIIGGGAAGHALAFELRQAAEVTLVDPKTYWEIPMAVPRLLVEPEGLNARISYDKIIGDGQHISGWVTRMTDRVAFVTVRDGDHTTLEFDYAVLATGSSYLDPLIKAEAPTLDSRADEIGAMHERLKQAGAVVVVGGGPVGVETAAELRETFPDLPVTLVHSGSAILDQAPSRFPGWGRRTLVERGVTLVLNDRVIAPPVGEQPDEGVVRTEGGRSIPAQAVIWAAGTKPNTDFIAQSWPGSVQANGLVKVDRYLRVVGHERVFAVGDITNLPEARVAIVAGMHAKAVAANLKTLVTGSDGETAPLKPYRPAVPGKGMGKLMVVSLGRRDGLTSLPFGQFRAPFLARTIKSRDMLVGSLRKRVNA